MDLSSIGFIGLGELGGALVRRLMQLGREVVAWDIVDQRIDALVDEGAVRGDSPIDVAERCDLVMACVTDTGAVREVVFGDAGIALAQSPPLVFVDSTTGDPDVASEMAERLHAVTGTHWIGCTGDRRLDRCVAWGARGVCGRRPGPNRSGPPGVRRLRQAGGAHRPERLRPDREDLQSGDHRGHSRRGGRSAQSRRALRHEPCRDARHSGRRLGRLRAAPGSRPANGGGGTTADPSGACSRTWTSAVPSGSATTR